jgi:hypothetical protein
MQQLQNAVVRCGDPSVQVQRQRARLARKQAWATRWLLVWALVAAISLVVVVASVTGVTDDPQYSSGITGIIVALVAGTLSVRAGLRVRQLGQQLRALGPTAPAPAPQPTLPPRSSVARKPMERLAEAEETLADLLSQISRGRSVPAESVEHTRRTGSDAAAALRGVAAQLHAVERARDHAPVLERGSLVDAVRRLRTQLDEGLDGYRSLVAAAGRVLAASSLAAPTEELTEATEHLAGLAVALRELSPDR